ncbi:MAG TPA: hypothetical protein VIR59_09210 [Gaiellaceae bacterium]
MASEETESEVQGGGLGQPLLIVAALAAGAAAALGAKALVDSRRKGVAGRPDSDEDLPSVLRRATLDLAIAATNQAAERLGEDQSEPEDEEAAVERS